MALKALDIFKLTPKKNCKDCGFPTCMAFCMKVASGAVEVSKCPHMSDDAIAKLSEATAPLMRSLKVLTLIVSNVSYLWVPISRLRSLTQSPVLSED